MKKAKERIIFDNYNPWDDYAEDAKESLINNEIKNPSQDDIWEEIYFMINLQWEDTLQELENFFDGKTWLAFGHCGLWYGNMPAGTVFTDFEKFFYQAIKDCDYWKIYDENGHLYLQCSHHDGTNCFEIKEVTEKGVEYLENWEYSYNDKDKRTEEYIHQKIVEKYSRLPRYAEKEWKCKRFEYEKECA